MLDSEEYLFLAINAAQQGDHHSALTYLHNSLELNPKNSRSMFLLGAQYAELQLFDRAIEQLEESIKLDSSFDLASLQLALLYIHQGSNAKAEILLRGTLDNATDLSTIGFSKSLMALNAKNIGLAIEKMQEVLDHQVIDPSIRQVMQNVLVGMLSVAEESAGVTTKPAGVEYKPTMLNIYRSASLGDEDDDQN